jgi:exopolysaccharide biosynthesis operon protein EpsL
VEILVKWLLASVMLLLALPTMAKEGDTFRPYVSYTRYYDSNLFRLAEGETSFVVEDGTYKLVTLDDASDQYGVLGVGLNVDWKLGRQQLVASLNKTLVSYSKYSSLDYDGEDYRATWNWRLGNHWSGQLGATQAVTQTNFSDLQTFNINGTPVFLAVSNLVTRDRQFASADWELHPRWRAGAGGAWSTSENSRLQQRSNDYEDDSEYVYLTYLTPKGSKLRGEFRHQDAKYPYRELVAGSLIDNSYTQSEYNFVGDWTVSGKLLTHLKLGLVDRQFPTVTTRDYSELAGRATVDYFPTGKTALTLAIYREPAPVEEVNSSFLINDGANLNAAWLLSDKVTVRASASYVQGTYDLTLPGLPQRIDDTVSGSLSLSYTPLPMATIDIGLQAGSRDSTYSIYDYSFHSVYLGVRADF